MPSISIRAAKLLHSYKGRPVDFVKDIIGATPTKQQEELLNLAVQKDSRVVVKSCTASGKTAVLAWLTLYFLVMYPSCKMLVTAPTSQQLHRAFRSELSLWKGKMNIAIQPFYELMKDNIHVIGKKDTQFCSFVTGSADNKESFAGLHAKKVVIMVDEASALSDEIFQTLYGTLSYGDTSFILVSNPVRATGAFFDLFSESNSRWSKLTFTSHESPNVDKEWIKEIETVYGIDSDFYRMRVLGEFPVMDTAQFIPTDIVEEAAERKLQPRDYINFERVLGCDVARFGDDSSIIVDRQGPKIHGVYEFRGIDTVAFTRKILEHTATANIDAIFVDGIGVGAGVVDQLKEFKRTGHLTAEVIDVVVSNKSTNPNAYYNIRSQTYGSVKDWLPYADIPAGCGLRKDLIGISYFFNSKLQLLLESKKDMKKRGSKSPDRSDALALTFARDVYATVRRVVGKRPVKKSKYKWV